MADQVSGARALPANLMGVDLLVLNEIEAAAYAKPADTINPRWLHDASITHNDWGEILAALDASGVANVVVTRGARGLLCRDLGARWQEVGTSTVSDAADSTGCGDALAAAVLFSLAHGHRLRQAVDWGTAAAVATLRSRHSVVGSQLGYQMEQLLGSTLPY